MTGKDDLRKDLTMFYMAAIIASTIDKLANHRFGS
jgi:hypothetical protein